MSSTADTVRNYQGVLLHPYQHKAFIDNSRHIAVHGGRRMGKSLTMVLAALSGLERAVVANDYIHVAIIAPRNDMLDHLYYTACTHLPENAILHESGSTKRISIGDRQMWFLPPRLLSTTHFCNVFMDNMSCCEPFYTEHIANVVRAGRARTWVSESDGKWIREWSHRMSGTISYHHWPCSLHYSQAELDEMMTYIPQPQFDNECEVQPIASADWFTPAGRDKYYHKNSNV